MANQGLPVLSQCQDNKASQVAIVMVPYPSQGHLNQLSHLSRLIITSFRNDLSIHFVGSAGHNRQAKLRVHGWNLASLDRIHFHDFIVPTFIRPSNLSTSFREPIAESLEEISTKSRRVVVIHDSLMSSIVQDIIPSIPNGESYIFHSVSSFVIYFYLWESMGKPFDTIDKLVPLKDIIPPFKDCIPNEFFNFINSQYACTKFNSGNLYNSSRSIEAPYLDSLAKDNACGSKHHWGLGPFNPVELYNDNNNNNNIIDNSSENGKHKCLKWLDKQSPDSVIYISVGTTTSMSDEQIHELAKGLTKSEQKFIWVLRDGDKGDELGTSKTVRNVEFPKGFEDELEVQGVVVRDWAPQLEILGHRSIGGFMSHCGWNSCMESISMGVPIAAWPMHSDQPRNAFLITKLLEVGLIVKDWNKTDKFVTATVIENAVRKLIASDEEGNHMRKRAAELRDVLHCSMDADGVTRMELNNFIDHVTTYQIILLLSFGVKYYKCYLGNSTFLVLIMCILENLITQILPNTY